MAKIKSISKSKLSQENKKICSIPGCEGRARRKGLCDFHYGRFRRHGDPLFVPASMLKPKCDKCIVEGCENKVRAGRTPYCEKHYYRIRRNGTIKLKPVNSRRLNKNGYISIKSDSNLSHRSGWVYEHRLILLNKIGPGKHLCYWCGCEVDFDSEYPKDLRALVIDHLDENKQNNSPDNLVPSCAICNARRGRQKMIETVLEKRARWIEFNGENKTLGEWADRAGITKASLGWRLKKGWSLERALTEKRGKTGPRRKVGKK